MMKNQYLIHLLENLPSSGHLKKILVQFSLVSFLLNRDESKTVSAAICSYSPSIIQNISQKIAHLNLIRNKNSPFRVLVALIEMAPPKDFILFVPTFLKSLNKFMDQYYLTEGSNALVVALKLNAKITEFLDLTLVNEPELVKQSLKTANILRQMLMRVKPSILTSNKVHAFYSLQIFYNSLRVLAGKKPSLYY